LRGLAKNTGRLVTLFALSNLWMARRAMIAAVRAQKLVADLIFFGQIIAFNIGESCSQPKRHDDFRPSLARQIARLFVSAGCQPAGEGCRRQACSGWRCACAIWIEVGWKAAVQVLLEGIHWAAPVMAFD
jgi:hypothetical protein